MTEKASSYLELICDGAAWTPRREVPIGEPECRNLPGFAAASYERHDRFGDFEVEGDLVENVGLDLAAWLHIEPQDAWCLVQRVHRPWHPRDIQRQRFIQFADPTDAERFVWENRRDLAKLRSDDIEAQIAAELIPIFQDIEDRRYDPSFADSQSVIPDMQHLAYKLVRLGEDWERADRYCRQERLSKRLANDWLRYAVLIKADRLRKEEPSEATLDGAAYAFMRSCIKNEFDLSIVSRAEAIRRLADLLTAVRRLKRLLRAENRARAQTSATPSLKLAEVLESGVPER